MTLIISTIENNEIFLLADSQITFPVHTYEKPFDALKMFFFDQRTAIAYSGTSLYAHQIIFQIYKKYNTDEGLESLADSINRLRDKEANPDFLLARASNLPEIIKISDSGVSKLNTKFTWIGDQDAANFVAKNFKGGSIFDLEKIFNQTVQHPEFPTVGGYSILARGTSKGFKFVPYMNLISLRYIPEPGEHTVDFGTNQTGGYGFTTITPTEIGQNGFGLFFFQGRFGYFFHVDLMNNIAERLKGHAVTPDEFIELVTKDTSIQLEYCGKLG